MGQTLFTQSVIAVIWDFDKTLTPTYMQVPLFKHYKIDETKFWNESNGLEQIYKDRGCKNVSRDSLYLNHILTYVRAGIFKDLSNKLLVDLGAQIEFYDGMPDCLARLKNLAVDNTRFRKHEITVEHYIVSTGLRQMIVGSMISPHVDGIWACEFVEGSVDPHYLDEPQKNLFPVSGPRAISDIAYAIDNTTKTRALFEINKGANKHSEIDVNATLAQEDRRVPFQNMIYIADGPSDVPAFSIMNQFGGRTFAVYKPGDAKQFAQVNRLQRENRVQGIGEASYVEGSLTSLWLSQTIEEIATRIVTDRESALRERVGATPQHIITEAAKPRASAEVPAEAASAPEAAKDPGKKLPGSEKSPAPTDAAAEG